MYDTRQLNDVKTYLSHYIKLQSADALSAVDSESAQLQRITRLLHTHNADNGILWSRWAVVGFLCALAAGTLYRRYRSL